MRRPFRPRPLRPWRRPRPVPPRRRWVPRWRRGGCLPGCVLPLVALLVLAAALLARVAR